MDVKQRELNLLFRTYEVGFPKPESSMSLTPCNSPCNLFVYRGMRELSLECLPKPAKILRCSILSLPQKTPILHTLASFQPIAFATFSTRLEAERAKKELHVSGDQKTHFI